MACTNACRSDTRTHIDMHPRHDKQRRRCGHGNIGPCGSYRLLGHHVGNHRPHATACRDCGHVLHSPRTPEPTNPLWHAAPWLGGGQRLQASEIKKRACLTIKQVRQAHCLFSFCIIQLNGRYFGLCGVTTRICICNNIILSSAVLVICVFYRSMTYQFSYFSYVMRHCYQSKLYAYFVQ